jgi:hypothetical protein
MQTTYCHAEACSGIITQLFSSTLEKLSMSTFKTLVIALISAGLLAACSSAERRAQRSQVDANKSQVELNKRKMEIVDDYQKCIDKSSSDEDRAKCEAKLKGAQGL